jgi:hypothetical protein
MNYELGVSKNGVNTQQNENLSLKPFEHDSKTS